jgi:phosphonate transport system permease protein
VRPSESPERRRQRRTGIPEGRGLLSVLLLTAFLISLFSVPWGSQIVHPGGLSALREFGAALISPEFSPTFLGTVARASWQTVTFAVAGVTIALFIGVPLGVLGSGVLVRGPAARRTTIVTVRFILGFLRSIHELVWAWLLVAAIGLSPMAAIVALGLNYGGILGRIYAELITDVPEEPLRALRASGASEVKIFLYGRLPMALPDIVSYTFYRLECGIRSAAIMSFVGIAGLGFQLQLSLADLHYDEVWTLLFALVALVAAVDWWSSSVRARLTT